MSNDLIKREDAIEVLAINAPFMSDEAYLKSYDALKSIPSADRPQGEWIEDPINKNNMYCSNCKVSYTKDFLRGMSLYHEPKDMPNFCPNCGANVTKGNTPILQELLSGLVGEEWKAKR